MNFNDKWYEVIKSEEDRRELEAKAKNMTAKELCNEYKVSEFKLRQVLKLYGIKPKVAQRPKQRDDIAHWALTYNDGKLRHIYYDMLKRCHNPSNKGYERYGAKGIFVCDEWRENCRNFYKWAKENGYKKGLSIDRIDNTKGYCPENCRWTTWKVQMENRSCTLYITYKGKRKPLADWAMEKGLNYDTLKDRIYRYGWSVERALKTPVDKD